jgi:hypothetical protein
VLDPALITLGVLLVMRNVPHGVYILVARHAEVLVDLDTAVFFQLEPGFLQKARSRPDARAHDDQIGRQGVLALEDHATASGRFGGRGVNLGDFGLHDEFDALGFHVLAC